ncbi:hypothetical protein [Pedococcus bigeumensis]|uniref:hypothetical protein n=1 Tax=Pedococcus bigeumensis TaxID=433644 RepID=UPI002FECF219
MSAASGKRAASHNDPPYRGLASASMAMGLLFGLGAFLIAAVFMGFDYFAVRDKPTERAVVISQGPSGTKETCGPRALTPDTPGEQTTYRSTDPPTGLPAEFRINHCPDWDDHPGDLVEVRRTGLGQDDIYIDPIESAGQWLGMAGIVGLVTTVIAAVLACVKEAWGVHRAQRRIRRRKQHQSSGHSWET